MKVEFGCPDCGRAVETQPGSTVRCRRCGAETALPAAEGLERCLACGCADLYRHRDFNQKLGLAIVILGVALWIWLGSFWPMVVAAAMDLLLFLSIPDVAICYRCRAHHRDSAGISAIAKFDLERNEKYRRERATSSGRPSARP